MFFRDFRGDGDTWMFTLEGDRKPLPLIEGPGSQQDANVSPDGRWIAYTSSESGRNGIYVQPLPPTGAKYQITATRPSRPVWSPDGRQIFFLEQRPNSDTGASLMSVDVRTQPGFSYSNPTRLTDEIRNLGNRPYTVMPDGRVMFLHRPAATPDQRPRNPEIRVTLNWFEELEQRVPR